MMMVDHYEEVWPEVVKAACWYRAFHSYSRCVIFFVKHQNGI